MRMVTLIKHLELYTSNFKFEFLIAITKHIFIVSSVDQLDFVLYFISTLSLLFKIAIFLIIQILILANGYYCI